MSGARAADDGARADHGISVLAPSSTGSAKPEAIATVDPLGQTSWQRFALSRSGPQQSEGSMVAACIDDDATPADGAPTGKAASSTKASNITRMRRAITIVPGS